MITDAVDTQLEPMFLRPLVSRPLVSVLIANYNYGRYIEQALDSVLAQSYTEFEIVVCDDGSTDNSVPIIRSYAAKHSSIRLIEQQNAGHGAALNRAFSECRGEVICLLDSDDFYVQDKLERVVASFQSAPRAGFAVHRVLRVNESLAGLGVWPLSAALPSGWHGNAILSSGGILSYLPPTSGLSFRREVAGRLFPVPASGPAALCPDQVIMRTAPLVTEICAVDAALTNYRIHSSNSYTTRRINARSVVREMELARHLWRIQYDFLEQNYPEAAYRLTSIESSGYFRQISYIEARLTTHGSARERHAELMRHIHRDPSAKYALFWSTAPFLPRPVFEMAINVLFTQGPLKQLLARLKKLA